MAEHRHCARHLQSNFTKKFKGQLLKRKMMVVAKAYTTEEFHRIMEEIKVADNGASE